MISVMAHCFWEGKAFSTWRGEKYETENSLYSCFGRVDPFGL